MSSMPQKSTEYANFTSKRSATVIMGHLDFISVLLRSIGGELYKLRRRAMPKILLLVATLIMLLTFGLPTLAASLTPHDTCTLDKHGQEHCIPQSEADIQKQKESVSAPLRLPASLPMAVGVINFIGMISLIILTGSIIGGEYSIGTIRIMLTRGTTRTQFLLAKIGAIIVCVLTTLFVLILVGIIVGVLFNLTTGIAIDFSFFTGEWLLHAILYVLISALELFMYAMIALCLATLGKTTAAGIAGALIWWVLEGVLGATLFTVGMLNKGPIGNLLQSIPNYFIGSNISALSDHQNQYLMNGAGTAISITNPISDVHAIIVLVTYLVAFIGVAWWAQQRDVTN